MTPEQLDEREERAVELLAERCDKGTGRSRELTLREVLMVSCACAHNNFTEEFWAKVFGVHHATISRYRSELTPLTDQATEEFRRNADEAAEATRDAMALVNGTLWPCWSSDVESKPWSGKHQTTGTRLPWSSRIFEAA